MKPEEQAPDHVAIKAAYEEWSKGFVSASDHTTFGGGYLAGQRAAYAQARREALEEACEILVGIETKYTKYLSGYPRRTPEPRPAAAVVAEAVTTINALIKD